MPEDRAHAFLQMIRRSERGRLKIYLGYGPGVGKTYQMLSEARRLKSEGIDVVVGLVETHGRADTVAMAQGLEEVPRHRTEYHGMVVEEMDVDAILRRRPQVVLIDELAHTNAPGSKNAKRYQDVQDVQAAGIHVISALNIQHLESLYNTVEQLVGVKVRERIPDSVLADADQVINIDLAAEDLQKRLRDGKIYPAQRVQASLDNFFTETKLEHLRELTLRELASQLDFKRREAGHDKSASQQDTATVAPDQIMVCLSSRGPNSQRLLRFASRLAGRMNRNWYAVYVQTPQEAPTIIDARVQRQVADLLTLANQLGATVFTFKGQDVADTILRFATEYRVGQVVIGRPRPIAWWKRLTGEKSVAEQLIHRVRGVAIVVVDAEGNEERSAVAALPITPPTENGTTKNVPVRTNGLSELLTADRILIWEDPATQADVSRRLVESITKSSTLKYDAVIKKLGDRESQGSTFLNEGIALPHARFDELNQPEVALGITHGGVLNAGTEKPIEVVFMLLSPMKDSNVHLQLLSRVARALQDRQVRQTLKSAATPTEVLEALRQLEPR